MLTLATIPVRLRQGLPHLIWMTGLATAVHGQDTQRANATNVPVGQSAPAQSAPRQSAPDRSDAKEMPAVIEVTVRGARLRPPSSPRDPTAASTVVSKESLRSPGDDTASVLARVPGVQVTRTGSASDLATASIRGATSAQTPVYLAGILLNDDVAGTADLSSVPLWMLDRIEVYRGHAPGFADQLGIGGAVFFEPRLPRRTRVGLGQSVGSFGERSSWVAGEVRAKRSSSLVALRRTSASNDYRFVDDGGTRFDEGDDVLRARANADFSARDAWAVGRHEPAKGSDITIITNAFDREQGVTGIAVMPAHQARARVRRFLGGISTRAPCAARKNGEADGLCKLSMSSSIVSAHTHLHDPLGELSLQSSDVSNDAVRFTQRIGIERRLGDRYEVGAHASRAFEHLTTSTSAEGGLHAKRTTSRLAVTGTGSPLTFLAVHVIAGLTCHTTEGAGTRSGCGAPETTGRVGTRLAVLPWLSFLANVGRYIRPPTLGELYGTSVIVRGNPALVSERGVSVDVGMRATRRGDRPEDLAGYLEIFAFNRWVSNLVAYRRASFGVVRPFNVGAARVAGVEIASGATWFDHLTHEIAVTFLDPRDVSQQRTVVNDLLPFRSRLVVTERAELFANLDDRAMHLDRVALGARLSHRSSSFADPAGLIVIPANNTVDIETSAHVLEGAFAGRLALRNAFDSPQVDTIGYPLPGRSYHASIEAWF